MLDMDKPMRSHILGVRITKEMFSTLSEESNKKDEGNISYLIRRILYDYIDNNKIDLIDTPIKRGSPAFGKGENNINWNGGTSTYPNHSEMKRNKITKLKQSNHKCEICKNKAYSIQHIDESKDNHDLNNLIVLCKDCHIILHRDRINKTSKYIKAYGMTVKDMVKKYGYNSSKFYSLHKQNKLKDFLKKNEKRT